VRPVAGLLVAALLVSCTGDSPAESEAGQQGDQPPGAKPVCATIPGRGVEGFVLQDTKRFDEDDYIAVRKDYRDPEGRLLVYLLGLQGEVGEGLDLVREVRLVDGTPARFLGGGGNWVLVWEDRPPCPQMAVVGNRFRREDFVDLLWRAHILDRESAFGLLPFDIAEWVAVFRTAPSPDQLREDTDALLEVAPGNLFVGPVGCHQGLAEDLGVDEGSYVSGVVAETEQELRMVLQVARSSRRFRDPPLILDEFVLLCGT
jgi:hypothetical protein